MLDERNKRKKLVITWKEDSKMNFNSLNINRSQLNQQNRIRKKSHVFSEYPEPNDIRKLPSIYKNWTILFRKEKSTKVLSKHQSWDHEIKLKSEKQLTFESIYTLSSKKLEELRKYLKINKRKRIYSKISIIRKIFDSVCVKKRRKTASLCRLQKIERNYNKKSIFII